MILHFTKLQFQGWVHNYFAWADIPVIDFISIDKIPKDAFPMFRDELARTNDPVNFQSGEVDLQLSFMSDAISDNGLTVEEFFDIRDPLSLRCLVEIDGEMKYIFLVDLDSFEINKNMGDEGKMIKMTLRTLESEWSKYADMVAITEEMTPIGGWFYSIIQSMLVETNVSVEYYLDIEAIVFNSKGFIPKSTYLIKGWVNSSVYKFFVSSAKGWNFMFKICPSINMPIDAWAQPVLKIFWRDSGEEYTVIKTANHVEGKIFNPDERAWCVSHAKREKGVFNENNLTLICTHQVQNGSVIKNSTFEKLESPEFTIEPAMLNIWWITAPSIWFDIIPESGLKLIEPERVGVNGFSWIIDEFGNAITEFSAPRCFAKNYWIFGGGIVPYFYGDEGYDDVAEAIFSAHSYSYLVETLRRVKFLELKLQKNFDVMSYSKIIFLNSKYWIESITELDHWKKKVKVKCFEITEGDSAV